MEFNVIKSISLRNFSRPLFITLISFICFGNIHAQEEKDDLKTANQEVFFLTDSLWQIEKMYVAGRIDEATYPKISGELLQAISAIAYSNASNYTRGAEPNATEIIEEIPVEDPSMESSYMDIHTDTFPPMEEMPEFKPPQTPMSMITGSGKRTSFKLRYGLFWSGVSKGKENSGAVNPEFKLWNSFCWFGEFDILLQTRLGKSNRGPFSLYYGIGWDYRDLVQKKDPVQLTIENDKPVFSTPQNTLDQASLNLGYFRIPAGLQFKKKNVSINAGAYLGFIIRHRQILEYKTSLDEEAELILDKDYHFEKTIYGLSASIGYKRLHLAFNYDLNNLFRKNDLYEYNAWKIGIMIF
jgi:hypothetical protein